ncbi:LysR family transcriptional regulator [Pseudomonas chlororaphis]|uniref:LysR family transcriptional regulator n=1 Tax=Pseudomonas chlororaphis TaxID=587753 RepID=A0A0D5XZB3_9PSED|nr:LysR family transcriptional regulator [Pseudomonas chlororaphis]
MAGLHVFMAVVETGNFTRAAAVLGVTPAAVSLAIGQLEGELRSKLFHRTTRGVSLTETGQRFHDASEAGYRSLLQARDELGESQGEPSGHLRISALHMARHLIVAPLLEDFFQRYPRVTLEIRYEDQLVDIVREQLDAGIRLADALHPGMLAVQITPPLHCALVASPDYLARHPAPRRIDDLREHACIRFRFPSSGQLHKWHLHDGQQEVKLDVPGRFISTDTQAVIEAARAGVGIAHVFIRERIAADLDSGRLVEVLPGTCQPLPPMWLYYANRKHVPLKLRALIDVLRDWKQVPAH